MRTSNPSQPPFGVVFSLAGVMVAGSLYWVLAWAPAHDRTLFEEQELIAQCRASGNVPVYWDGEIECHPLREKKARK
jgi:hypothetical protein